MPPRSAERQASLPLDGADVESDRDDGPVFRARLFGTFRVETAGGEVEGWSIQKARELLAYLLAHGGTPVLRDTAAEALGLSGENQGGHPLPNAAYYVRRTLSRADPRGSTRPSTSDGSTASSSSSPAIWCGR